MSKMGIACGMYAKSKGVSGAYISRKSGLTQDKISRIFRGHQNMTADELMRVCAALETDPVEINRWFVALGEPKKETA